MFLSKQDLLKTKEYWIADIQLKLFKYAQEYLDTDTNDITTRTQLAKKLGVTKGYVSQILNGNVNFSIGKLVELSLSLDLAPVLKFTDLNNFIDNKTKFEVKRNSYALGEDESNQMKEIKIIPIEKNDSPTSYSGVSKYQMNFDPELAGQSPAWCQ